jgi:hypothetical protein
MTDENVKVVENVVDDFTNKLKNLFSEQLLSDLTVLGQGVLVASTDAGLVYLSDNIDKVDLGDMKPTVVEISKIIIKQLRNTLHGSVVTSSDNAQPIQVNPEVLQQDKPAS